MHLKFLISNETIQLLIVKTVLAIKYPKESKEEEEEALPLNVSSGTKFASCNQPHGHGIKISSIIH